MQNYSRIYEYINEYQNSVNEVYSKHAPAYLVTYLHINKETTVWDTTDLFGGSYEQLGELSGIKFSKFLLLPIYFIEETTYDPTAEETGFVHICDNYIILPSTYGFTPYVHDLVKFTQYPTDKLNETLFSVTGIQHTENTANFYWKLKVINEQMFNLEKAENQIEDTYVFYDYDKKLHNTEDVVTMTHLLSKNESIKENLKNLFDQNSGLYFV